MKYAWDYLSRLLVRFRYPVSLPEDVAKALGLTASVSNLDSFNDFVNKLTSGSCLPTRLKKFMTRQEAEQAFHTALRQERFKYDTLCSYYFNEGWLEFVLQFDDQSRLRRIYIQHKNIKHDRGIEIPLLPHQPQVTKLF